MDKSISLEDMVEFAENPEPRCPCVLLLDTSGSMRGERIQALQEKAAKKVELDLSTHLTDLKDIREGAMRNGAWSAAVTAEVARGKAAGLYINRSELVVNKVETMNKEQILERLKELYYETGGILPAGKIIEGDVEPS